MARLDAVDDAEQRNYAQVEGDHVPEGSGDQVVQDHHRIGDDQREHRQVVQAHHRVQPPRVGQSAQEVDQVGTAPAQLLGEVAGQRVRRDGGAEGVQREDGLVAGLDDLPGEEAVLAVLDRDPGDVAVLQHVMQLEQDLAAVRGETAGQAHHGGEDPLEVLEPLLGDIPLQSVRGLDERLHLRVI